ncbi:carbohydrate kinase [Moraxella macacae 0408225]|uniref:Carbohydrate kinase n=1 Tax=Moraxella macacae 0408225 TaxID=1230338 RepID=L2F9U6_9GAMM|nr:adenosine kinase [Moraxella macacae]ELA09243.1 carbohydrate kinase [Moraxella macacae 0408225]
MTKIIGIGNALVDIEFLLNDTQLANTGLEKGNMTLASQSEQRELMQSLDEQNIGVSKQASGGSSANAIVAMASLGSETFYICQVADDALGQFYLADLNQIGVKTSKKSLSKQGVTGTCLSLVTPDAERTMQTHLGISAEIDENAVDFSQLTDANWLYIEGYLAMSPSVQEAILALKQQAVQHGVKIAVSFADPAVVKFAKDGLDVMLAGGVDVVFCNCEEAKLYTNATTHDTACQSLLKVAKMAVVTNGANGTMVAYQDDYLTEKHDNNQVFIPSVAVENVLDTTGAGDSYAGAFLHAFADGKDLLSCGKLASCVASLVIAQFGARLTAEQYQYALQNLN